MTIYGYVLPGAASIANWTALVSSLTERAKYKLKILDWHKAHGDKCSLTARHFGIGRMTLYHWLARYKQYGITGLNEHSRKPKNVRKPITSWTVVTRVVQLRNIYPAWSKYKLRALLKKEGVCVSASTIGRILKRKGLINERISRKRKRAARSPKARFPKGFKIAAPGDMIQMDTKHIMLVGGRRFYQFTAIDVLTKRRVLRVYPSESSRNGANFLNECVVSFPFAMKTVQTDNGSPFLKEFDKQCKVLHIPHYFIYPRNPKQNSYVEISHQADKREFYQQNNASPLLEVMRQRIKEREYVWNEIRPHEALGQLTPSEYLQKLQSSHLPTQKVIILQT